jgi:hypothetical protein
MMQIPVNKQPPIAYSLVGTHDPQLWIAEELCGLMKLSIYRARRAEQEWNPANHAIIYMQFPRRTSSLFNSTNKGSFFLALWMRNGVAM